MTMTFFLDSKGTKIKTYDLDQMFLADGWNMPGEEARETFAGLRSAMRDEVDLLAKLQHGTGPMGLSIPGWVLCSCKRLDYSEHITVYRELEHARLDVMGSCDNYVYRAWLTKPSKNHPLGQVRSKVRPMVEGVRLEGNGKFMSVYLEGELIGNV